MDPTTISPTLGLGMPLASAAAGIVGYGWFTRKGDRHRDDTQRQLALVAEEQARRDQRMADAALLRPAEEQWQRSSGIGQMPLVAVGTAAANQLVLIAEKIVLANAEGHIGTPFLAEPDAASREATLRDLPARFPRPIALNLPLLAAGLKGATVQEGEQLRQYWLDDVQQITDVWLTQLRLRAKPVCLVMCVSPGGSAPLGWPIVRRFKAEYDQADVYVVIVLDHKTDRRELNIPQLLDLYSQDDLVRGFLILENRRSSEQFDEALGHLLASLLVAPWNDSRPQSGFNVLPDVFRRHKVATLRTWHGWLPVRYEPPAYSLPPLYFTDRSFCQAQAIRGIAEVLANPDLQSLPLPAAERPQFLYVSAPIRPEPHLRSIADRVRQSTIPGLTFDTTLGFASIGYPLQPSTPQAPLRVTAIRPVACTIDDVKDYVYTASTPDSLETAATLPISVHGMASNGRRR